MPYSYNSSPSTGVDLNEDGKIEAVVPFGQRHWTGVWRHRADTKVSPRNYETGNAGHEDTMYDSEFDGHPEAEVAWLVSGNEGHSKRLGLFESSGLFADYLAIPDGISRVDRSNRESGYGNAENAWQDYREVVASRLANYDHPLNELPDPDSNDSTVWILKPPVRRILDKAVSFGDKTGPNKSSATGGMQHGNGGEIPLNCRRRRYVTEKNYRPANTNLYAVVLMQCSQYFPASPRE